MVHIAMKVDKLSSPPTVNLSTHCLPFLSLSLLLSPRLTPTVWTLVVEPCPALLHSEPCRPLGFIKRTCSVFAYQKRGLQEIATSPDGCINSYVLLQALLSNYNPGLQLSPAAKQIELDLLRTLPNNKHYESPHSSGYYSLYRERELDLLRTLPNNKH